MSLISKIGFIFFVIVAVAVVYGAVLLRHGVSARANPSALESFTAREIRNLSIPSAARKSINPFQATPDVLDEAREHFADHCATCHGNDGSGKTEIGQNLYPKVPDMRLTGTQNLTDGEIYYIIHEGVRLTGMPAWGTPEQVDSDSWKLVLFIRHLPQLTPQELKDMERFNPTSEVEREERKRMERFLNGGDLPDNSAKESKHNRKGKK